MRYRSFLFLFVLFFVVFATIASADIRMTGPTVSASATADPGRANVLQTLDPQGNIVETQDASYDLAVEAEVEAYGKGWVGVRFRANARVKGSANKNSTVPPGAYYLNVQRDKVTYTSNFVAYAGGTQKTVSRYNVPFAKSVNRSFILSGHGNASHYIGWTETPEKVPSS